MKRPNTLLVASLGASLLVGGGIMIARCFGQEASPLPPLNPGVTAPARALGDAFAAVAAHVQPAVVSVYSEKMIKFHRPEFEFPFEDDFFKQFFGQRFQVPQQGIPKEYSVPQRGMGSGMILDAEGTILTNNHVVKDVDEIRVQLADKRQFEARIVATDPKTDVAIIRVKGRVGGLPHVELGDSSALKVGELVVAIGAPFGLMQTVTTGIISAKGRSDVGITDFEDFLQTDAPINPGNSGGPLVSMRGEVIGMNTAIASRVGQFGGVGFAIPVNLIKSLLPALVKGDKVSRGSLGVIIQEVTKDLAAQFRLPDKANGVLIAQVNPESAAEKAGLKPGDFILRFNGKDIRDTRDLRNQVAATSPGSTVRVDLIRDGKERTLEVTLKAVKPDAAAVQAKEGESTGQLSRFGLKIQTLTPELARKYDLAGKKGVVVIGVGPGSPSSLAGIQEGDLVVEANRQSVSTAEDLDGALRGKGKDGVLLLIQRKDTRLFVVIQAG